MDKKIKKWNVERVDPTPGQAICTLSESKEVPAGKSTGLLQATYHFYSSLSAFDTLLKLQNQT